MKRPGYLTCHLASNTSCKSNSTQYFTSAPRTFRHMANRIRESKYLTPLPKAGTGQWDRIYSTRDPRTSRLRPPPPTGPKLLSSEGSFLRLGRFNVQQTVSRRPGLILVRHVSRPPPVRKTIARNHPYSQGPYSASLEKPRRGEILFRTPRAVLDDLR